MGSDDLYKSRRRYSRKHSKSPVESSSNNKKVGSRCMQDIFNSGTFLNSTQLSGDLGRAHLNQQISDGTSVSQSILQLHYQALSEWKRDFLEWKAKYGRKLKKKKGRSRSNNICRGEGKEVLIKTDINIGDKSGFISKTSRLVPKPIPPYFTHKACLVRCDSYGNYFTIRDLNTSGDDVCCLEAFSISDKSPLLEKFKRLCKKENKREDILDFVTACKTSGSSLLLRDSNKNIWHYAGSIVENSGTPNMSELSQYLLRGEDLTSLFAKWSLELPNFETPFSDETVLVIGDNYLKDSLDYFISLRAWGAAFSLCGSNLDLRAHVQKRYLKEIGRLNPLSTAFSFINNEPIEFLKSSEEEFIENYQDHLLVILLFGHLNTESAISILFSFAERFDGSRVWSMYEFCTLLAGCYPTYQFNDDGYQLIGHCRQWKDDLLNRNAFIEKIILNEVIEYGLKDNTQSWSNPIEFKLYIVRYLIQSGNYKSAFLFAENIANGILSNPKQHSKFTVYQLYSMSETLFLCLNCYEDVFLDHPEWLSSLKNVYKETETVCARTSTPEKTCTKMNEEDLKSSVETTNKTVNTNVDIGFTCETENKGPLPLEDFVSHQPLPTYNTASKISVNEKKETPVSRDETSDECTRNLSNNENGDVEAGPIFVRCDPTVDSYNKCAFEPVSSFTPVPLMDINIAPKKHSHGGNDMDDSNENPGGSGILSNLLGMVRLKSNKSNAAGDNQFQDDNVQNANNDANANNKPKGPTMGKVDVNTGRSGILTQRSSHHRYMVP